MPIVDVLLNDDSQMFGHVGFVVKDPATSLLLQIPSRVEENLHVGFRDRLRSVACHFVPPAFESTEISLGKVMC